VRRLRWRRPAVGPLARGARARRLHAGSQSSPLHPKRKHRRIDPGYSVGIFERIRVQWSLAHAHREDKRRFCTLMAQRVDYPCPSSEP
jgi:hypothetical protein